MNSQLATAMALALVVGVTGLSITPVGLAGHGNCHKDFDIPDTEPDDQDALLLTAGASEVGYEDVLSVSDGETLHVKLVDAGNNGQLNWTVLRENAQGQCVQYDSTNCDRSMRIVMELTCDLDPNAAPVEDYWVLFEAGLQNSIEFKAWSVAI